MPVTNFFYASFKQYELSAASSASEYMIAASYTRSDLCMNAFDRYIKFFEQIRTGR